jgi:outer membrane lipoprotein carrier protein
MMNCILRFALCLMRFCGLAAPSAHAADTAAVIAKMQAVYAAMDSFSADFTQELHQRESGVTEKRRGTIVFKKPLLLRWETAAPHAELLMVTEKEIWDWLPDEELAYRYSRQMAEDSRSLIQVVTGQSPLDRDFDVEPVPGAEEGLVHVLLYPKEASTELTEVQLWIDPKTSLMRRVMVMDFYGNTNTVELSSIRPDAEAPASLFTFTPPAGTEVEDHVGRTHPAERALNG